VADDGAALRLRLVSALTLAPVALGVVALGGWLFALFVAVMTALMAYEWSRLSEARFGQRYGRAGGALVLGVGLVAILLTLLGRPGAAIGAIAVAVLAGALLAWLRGSVPLWTGIGVVLVSLPAVALIWLRSLPELGLSAVLWLVIVVWATDSAAYVVGRRVGGARLAPSISPGKTWSGLGGGVIGASVASVIMAWALGSERLVHAAGLGAVFAVIAQLGDLAESMLKRRAGVKDSGSLIPGHGGVLDRVDGFLITAPALALLLGLKAWPWP
jgi:phosphatidate cytidylyltransferase